MLMMMSMLSMLRKKVGAIDMRGKNQSGQRKAMFAKNSLGRFKVDIHQTRRYGNKRFNYATVTNTNTGKSITDWFPPKSQLNEDLLMKRLKW